MTALLQKFRINYSDLVVIDNEPPSTVTVNWFDGLVRHFLRKEEQSGGDHTLANEMRLLSEKTNRYLRLRELLMDHSSDSGLVVM